MNRFSSTRPEAPGLLPSGSRSPHGQSRSGVAAKEGDQRTEPIPSFHWSNFFFLKHSDWALVTAWDMMTSAPLY